MVHIAHDLIKAGVPMILVTKYDQGIPHRRYWMPCAHEKRGKFHFLNGKRIPGAWVKAAISAGLVANL